jgi:hypothetical protein
MQGKGVGALNLRSDLGSIEVVSMVPQLYGRLNVHCCVLSCRTSYPIPSPDRCHLDLGREHTSVDARLPGAGRLQWSPGKPVLPTEVEGSPGSARIGIVCLNMYCMGTPRTHTFHNWGKTLGKHGGGSERVEGE